MNPLRALVISLICHVVLFGVLASGIKFSNLLKQKPSEPIAARLIIKKKRDKDHLPRKSRAVPESEDKKEKEKEKNREKEKTDHKTEKALEKPIEKVLKVADVAKTTKPQKKGPDYTKALASLSQSFAKELADSAPEEPEGEVIADATFFDQVYALIKESFVVPPHINGPQGKDLQTVLKLFLASDGSLLKIDLVTASGDEHFDKAVLDGTRRVDNFGLVPVGLQNMVRERGIVVELCPFTCQER